MLQFKKRIIGKEPLEKSAISPIFVNDSEAVGETNFDSMSTNHPFIDIMDKR